MMQCEENLLVLSENNRGSKLAVFEQHRSHSPISVVTTLKWSLILLILFSSVAHAQSVQTIDSETQLASLLCRNPQEEARNELLLDKNSQLVNVTLWKALLDCASGESQRSATKSTELYKLALGVADRLKKPELIATTYYYLGQTLHERMILRILFRHTRRVESYLRRLDLKVT